MPIDTQRAVRLLFFVTVVVLGGSLAARSEDSANPLGIQQGYRILEEVHAPPQNASERNARLQALFTEGGVEEKRIHTQPVPGTTPPTANLLVELGASDQESGPGDTIVLGAHFDTMPGSNGVIDNWSGCVVLAALASEMHNLELRHRFLLVGFAGEEHGQLGSRAFLQHIERKRIKAMINLECLGVEALRTWSNQSSDDLEALLHQAAEIVQVEMEQRVLFGYTADSASFTHAGIPSITVHSLDGSALAIINTPRDDGRRLRMGRLRKALECLLMYVVILDGYQGDISRTDNEGRLAPAKTGLTLAGLSAAVGGVRIDALGPASHEAQAGMQPGDVICAVDALPVARPEEVVQALLTTPAGATVTFSVLEALRPDATPDTRPPNPPCPSPSQYIQQRNPWLAHSLDVVCTVRSTAASVRAANTIRKVVVTY